MARLPIVSWIGNAAAVLVGGWGTVSRQAQAAGCSRQAAYDQAERAWRNGGKRRGCCPYELLGLRLPTTEWWQLLHTSLADSTQELSSSEVTI